MGEFMPTKVSVKGRTSLKAPSTIDENNTVPSKQHITLFALLQFTIDLFHICVNALQAKLLLKPHEFYRHRTVAHHR